jgi:hypothetical protein
VLLGCDMWIGVTGLEIVDWCYWAGTCGLVLLGCELWIGVTGL